MTYTGDLGKCTPENCSIVVDSDDEIGDSARAFNSLVNALASSMRTQAAVRSFTQMLSSRLELDTVANGALPQLLEHTGASAGAILVDIGGESAGAGRSRSPNTGDHRQPRPRPGRHAI